MTVFRRIEEAIEWADALNVLRLQLERMHARVHPLGARIQPGVRGNRGTAGSSVPARSPDSPSWSRSTAALKSIPT